MGQRDLEPSVGLAEGQEEPRAALCGPCPLQSWWEARAAFLHLG